MWLVYCLCLAWLRDTEPGFCLRLVMALFTFGLAGLHVVRVLSTFGLVALHIAWVFFLTWARLLFTCGLAGLHLARVLSTFGLVALHFAVFCQTKNG